ncbi:MAG: M23 family metallopeptidase, partial [Chloroflexi bacterium]|nr:M23 family metallopeptidase [Chloroflexota bacterium]
GQTVQPGDQIALSGNTGLSTGAHLHWDMRIRGLNVDPLQFTRRAFP